MKNQRRGGFCYYHYTTFIAAVKIPLSKKYKPPLFPEVHTCYTQCNRYVPHCQLSINQFVQHNFDNHEGEVPVWAAVEVLSFGTLSKIIKNLKTGTGSSYSILAANYQYKSKKGNLVNPSQKMLASWI